MGKFLFISEEPLEPAAYSEAKTVGKCDKRVPLTVEPSEAITLIDKALIASRSAFDSLV